VAELAAGLQLALRDREPARDLLGAVGAPLLQATAEIVGRGRRDEDPHGVRHRVPDLAGALELDLEHDAVAAVEPGVHLGAQGAVAVRCVVRVLDEVAPENVGQVAEAVGRAYGEELASEIGVPDEPGYDGAVRAVATAMTGLGFSVDPDVSGQRLLTSHCPFGEAATSHPEVICSLDRGIVAGMFGGLSYNCSPVVIPHKDLKGDCVTQVPVTIG